MPLMPLLNCQQKGVLHGPPPLLLEVRGIQVSIAGVVVVVGAIVVIIVIVVIVVIVVVVVV